MRRHLLGNGFFNKVNNSRPEKILEKKRKVVRLLVLRTAKFRAQIQLYHEQGKS